HRRKSCFAGRGNVGRWFPYWAGRVSSKTYFTTCEPLARVAVGSRRQQMVQSALGMCSFRHLDFVMHVGCWVNACLYRTAGTDPIADIATMASTAKETLLRKAARMG